MGKDVIALISKVTERIQTANVEGLEYVIEKIAIKLDNTNSVQDLSLFYTAFNTLQSVNDHKDNKQPDIGPALFAFYKLAERSEYRGLTRDQRVFLSETLAVNYRLESERLIAIINLIRDR